MAFAEPNDIRILFRTRDRPYDVRRTQVKPLKSYRRVTIRDLYHPSWDLSKPETQNAWFGRAAGGPASALRGTGGALLQMPEALQPAISAYQPGGSRETEANPKVSAFGYVGEDRCPR